eukprot:TRINITY_DN16394_c0_g1_i15.p1 TRINITY_DN16394_c0_g1~~TRINITY_DN16394_c0_g1_i15.p1  ORF type:complete len:176 (-),score=36.31 TRINITY_DN16394_c0_g1_i15:19-546(-)
MHPNRLQVSSEQIAEEILRGRHDTTWGLLSILRNTCPQTGGHNEAPLHLLRTGLPYSLPEIVALEQSVMLWLQSLRLVKDEGNASLLDIEERVCSGTLLCDLATVLGRQKARVCGVVLQPKNPAAALANIRKALELFRELPQLDRRFLWSEKDIQRGDRGAVSYTHLTLPTNREV